jgi:hypothetical protein
MARRSLELRCRPLLVLPVLLVPAAYGCSEYGDRIYSAHPYRAGRGCLEHSLAIGVVQAGQLPANCPGQCLLLEETLYVSNVCSPTPLRAEPVDPAKSSACAEALGLLDSRSWCEPPDAGASADAAPLDQLP